MIVYLCIVYVCVRVCVCVCACVCVVHVCVWEKNKATHSNRGQNCWVIMIRDNEGARKRRRTITDTIILLDSVTLYIHGLLYLFKIRSTNISQKL